MSCVSINSIIHLLSQKHTSLIILSDFWANCAEFVSASCATKVSLMLKVKMKLEATCAAAVVVGEVMVIKKKKEQWTINKFKMRNTGNIECLLD